MIRGGDALHDFRQIMDGFLAAVLDGINGVG